MASLLDWFKKEAGQAIGGVNNQIQNVVRQAPQFIGGVGQGIDAGIRNVTNQPLTRTQQQVVNRNVPTQMAFSVTPTVRDATNFSSVNNIIQNPVYNPLAFTVKKLRDQALELQRTNPAIYNKAMGGNPLQPLMERPVETIRGGLESMNRAVGELPVSKQFRTSGVGKLASENVIDPITASYNRTLSQTVGTNLGDQGYDSGLKGGAQLLEDAFNIGTVAYTGSLAKQLAHAPLKQFPGLAARLAPRQFASGATQNVVSQFAQGKKINEIDYSQAAMGGLAYAALGTGIPLAGKVTAKAVKPVAKVIEKQLGKTEPGFIALPGRAGKNAVGKPFKEAGGKKVVEVSDKGAKIKPDPIAIPGGIREGTTNTKVGAVLDHPKLYKAYPELRDVDLDINIKKGVRAGGVTVDGANGTKNISITAPNLRAVKKPLMHEVTHPIQEISGLATGTNPQQAMVNFPRKEYKKLAEQIRKQNPEMSKRRAGAVAISDAAMIGYNRSAGEAQARNVAGRMNLTDAQRRATPFNETFDVPLKNQIVNKQTQGAQSITPPKGYKISKEGELVNIKTGKVVQQGEAQQIMQNQKLTKAENNIAKGKETYAQAEAETTKLSPLKKLSDDELRDEFYKGQQKGVELLKSGKKREATKLMPQQDKILAEMKSRLEQLDVEPPKGKKIAPDGSLVPVKKTGAKIIGDQYEAQVAQEFKAKGYKVTPNGKIKGALDDGIDNIARKGKEILLIQNKVRGQGNEVHLNTVTLLKANADKWTKQNPGKTIKPIVYTTNTLDAEATKFASRNGIEIVKTPMPGQTKFPLDMQQYNQASKVLGQNRVNKIMNDLTPEEGKNFLRQMSNSNSSLSKTLQNSTPEQYRTVARGYYNANDADNFAQRRVMEGVATRLRRADNPEQVRSVVSRAIARQQEIGGKTTSLDNLQSKLKNKDFVQQLVQSRNHKELVQLVDSANLQPLATPFRQPRGVRVKMEKQLPNAITGTPEPRKFELPGETEYGFLKTVKNSRFTSTELSAMVGMAPGRGVKSNRILIKQAQEMVSSDSNAALKYVNQNDDDLSQAVGGMLLKLYDKNGQKGEAFSLSLKLAQKNLEAGRYIQANTLFNKLSPEGIQKYAASQMLKQGKQLPQDVGEKLVTMVKNYQKMPQGDAKEVALKEILDVIGKARGSAFTDKVITLWKSGLLSGPITTMGNLTGNTIKGVVKKTLDDPIATGFDIVGSLLTGKRSKAFTFRGEFSGGKEGLVRGGRYMKTGVDPRNPIDKLDQVQTYFSDKWHGKIAQKYSDTVFRAMGAEDQPFYYATLRNTLYDKAIVEAKNQGLHGQARKTFINKFLNNTPDDVEQLAVQEAKTSVFANKTFLSNLASRLTRADQPAVRLVGNFLIPFGKVPSAVATEAITRTPIGVAKEVVSQVYQHTKNGKAYNQRAMVDALSKSTVGTVGFMGAGAALQANDMINLAMPTTDAEKNLWELEGRQPYSIRMGDSWVSLNYIQPFGSLLAMGAQYKKTLDDPEGGGHFAALTSSVFAGALAVTQQSFLKGVSGALASLADPTRSESFIEQTVGSVVPNIVKTIARATDPLQRQINTPVESIIAGIPGARQNLLPKLNVFGQELARPQSVLGTLFNPLRPTKAVDDPFIKELRRLRQTENNVLPESFDKSAFGKDNQITPAQINELTKAVGPETLQQWKQIMNDPRYASLSDAEKAKALKNAYQAVSQGNKFAFAGQNELPYTEAKDLNRDTKRYLRGSGSDFLSQAKGYDTTNPKQRYEDALAEYNDKKKAGEISDIQDINAQENLRKLQAKSTFSREANELYSLSNKEIDAYLKSTNNGNLWNEVLSMDEALVAAGFSSKFRDKYGRLKNLAGTSGSGGGRSGGGKTAFITTGFKTAGKKVSTPRGISVKKPSFKNKKLAVSKLPKLRSLA